MLKVGENCSKYLAKGKRVLVEGRLKTNAWTSKDGDKRSKVYVVANSVQFLSPVNGEGGGSMPQVNAKTQAAPAQEEVSEFDSVPF